MSEVTPQDSKLSPPDSREDLRLELQYFEECFWRNEQIGEQRTQFFITLVTAIIAGLSFIIFEMSKDSAKLSNEDIQNFAIISAIAFGALLALGLVSRGRIIRRDCTTDEYKIIAADLRDKLGLPDPFSGVRKIEKSKPIQVGLAHLIGTVNSALIFMIVLAITIASYKAVTAYSGTFRVPSFTVYFVCGVVAGLLFAIVAWWCQKKSAKRRRDAYFEGLKREYNLRKIQDRSEALWPGKSGS